MTIYEYDFDHFLPFKIITIKRTIRGTKRDFKRRKRKEIAETFCDARSIGWVEEPRGQKSNVRIGK